MTVSIGKRVAALEKATCPAEPMPTWGRVILKQGETEEEAIARHAAEHPEAPTPTNWIVRRLVCPSTEVIAGVREQDDGQH